MHPPSHRAPRGPHPRHDDSCYLQEGRMCNSKYNSPSTCIPAYSKPQNHHSSGVSCPSTLPVTKSRPEKMKERESGNVVASAPPTALQTITKTANQKIALIMLMFAAHAVNETGILSQHTLSTEVVVRDFCHADMRHAYEYLDGEAYRSHFSWNEEAERLYSSASESTSAFLRNMGKHFNSSRDAASLLTRCKSTTQPRKEDNEEGQPVEETDAPVVEERITGSDERRSEEAVSEEAVSDDDESIGNSVISTENVLTPNVQKQQQFLADDLYALPDNQARFQRSAPVWENVLSFLSWKEVLLTRGVSRFHFFQSLPFVTVTRMPYTRTPALFIPARQDFDRCAEQVERELKPRSRRSSWPRASMTKSEGAATQERRSEVTKSDTTQDAPELLACGKAAAGVSNQSESHAAAPSKDGGSAHDRAFIGQLRRDGTVAMMRWMAHYVCGVPLSSILSVENHRNILTGRGKGCAWMTVRDAETLQILIRAHHRMFYDVINRVEGMWIVQPGQESVLQSEIDHLVQVGRVHLRYMPRRAIVLERPCVASTSKMTSSSSVVKHPTTNPEMQNASAAPYTSRKYTHDNSPLTHMHTHAYNARMYDTLDYPYDGVHDTCYTQPWTAYSYNDAESIGYRYWLEGNRVANHASNYAAGAADRAVFPYSKQTRSVDVRREIMMESGMIEFTKPGMWNYNPYKALVI